MESLKKIIKRIRDGWKNHPFFASLIVSFFIFLTYASIYLDNPGISYLDDHFFHFKYAYLLRTEGLNVVKNFDWIYLSKAAQEKTRFGLPLFQVALVPFTYIKDMLLGLKLSDIFWASFSMGLLYYFLRLTKIKFALLSILLLLSSSYFAIRILSGRALVLIISLVFLEIYLAAEKKYIKLFLVSLIHVLWHETTFFLPLTIVIMVEVARYLDSKKFFLKNIWLTASASFIGMAFFPDFPVSIYSWLKNISLLFFHSNQGQFKAEGIELYKVDPTTRVFGSQEIFIFLAIIGICGVIYYYVRSKKEQTETVARENKENSLVIMYSLFFFFLFALFGSLIVSGRLYDFYLPSAVFLAATVFSKLVEDKKILFANKFKIYFFSALLIFVIFSAGNNLINKKVLISKSDWKPVADVAKWVDVKSSDRNKDIIFLHNWSDFAVAFFFNSNNRYTMGLEPMMLYDYDKKLYWKWYNIFANSYYCEEEKDCADGKELLINKVKNLSEDERKKMFQENGRKIIESIKNDFKSRFVITNSSDMINLFALNDEFIEDKYESKSEINGAMYKAYKLK